MQEINSCFTMKGFLWSFLAWISHHNLFNFVFNFCWNLVSQVSLKSVSCESICSKGNSPLPHTLKCLSTFNCWYCSYWICLRYTLTLSLGLVFPFPVSPTYSSLHVSQITTYIILKLSHVKRFFNSNIIWTFLKM